MLLRKKFLKKSIASLLTFVFVLGIFTMPGIVLRVQAATSVSTAAELMQAISDLRESGGDIIVTADITLADSSNLYAYKPITITLNSGKCIYSGNSCTFGLNIKLIGSGRVGTYDYDTGVLISNWVTGVVIDGAIIETTSTTKSTMAVTCSNVTIQGTSKIVGIASCIYQYTSGSAKTLNITGGTIKATGSGACALIVCDNYSTTNISGTNTVFNCPGSGSYLSYSGGGVINITGGKFKAKKGFYLGASGATLYVGGSETETVVTVGTGTNEGAFYSASSTTIVLYGTNNFPVTYMDGQTSRAGSILNLRKEVYTVTPSTSIEDGRYINTTTMTIAIDANKALDGATQSPTIHYTTDGTPATNNSTTYSSPITLPVGMTKINIFVNRTGYTSGSITLGTYHCVGTDSVSTASGLMTAISNLSANGGKITVTADITLSDSSNLTAYKLVTIALNSGKAIYSGNSCTFGSNIKIIGSGRVGGSDLDTGVLIAASKTGVTINGAIIETTSSTKQALAIDSSGVAITGKSKIVGLLRAIYFYSSSAKSLDITGGTVSTSSSGACALIVTGAYCTVNIGGKDTLFDNPGSGSYLSYSSTGLISITGGTFNAAKGFYLDTGGYAALYVGGDADVNVTSGALYSATTTTIWLYGINDMPVTYMDGGTKQGSIYNLRKEVLTSTPSSSPTNGVYPANTTVTIAIDSTKAMDANSIHLHYTKDGTTPTATNTASCLDYSGAISLATGTNGIRIFATHGGGNSTAILLATYQMNSYTFNVDAYGAVADGVTDSTVAINTTIAAAKACANTSIVTLSSGTYLVDKKVASPVDIRADYVFIIDDIDNCTIQGSASPTTTIKINNPSIGGLYIKNSTNVLVKDLIIDYVTLPYTQGTIYSVDATAGTITIDLDNGYADFEHEMFSAGVLSGTYGMPVTKDSDKSLSKFGPEAIITDSFTRVSENRWKIQVSPGCESLITSAGLANGTRYVQLAGRYVYAFFAKQNTNIEARDITIYASPTSGSVWANNTDVTVHGMVCEIKPSTDRLLSINGDVVHSYGNRGGMLVEDCSVYGMSDDGLNIHSRAGYIREIISSTELEINTAGTNFYEVGDVIQIYDSQNIIKRGTAEITDVEVIGEYIQNITLDTAIPGIWSDIEYYYLSDAIYNQSACGQNSTFQNNTFYSHRGRNMVLRTHDSTVQGNSFCVGYSVWTALLLEFAHNWGEGIAPYNMTIYNNTFTGSGAARSNYAIGLSSGTSVPGIQARTINNITIDSNTFNTLLYGAIYINGADNVDMLSNAINVSTSRIAGPTIYAEKSTALTINGLTGTDANSKYVTTSVIQLANSVVAGTAGYTSSNINYTLTYNPSGDRPSLLLDQR